MVCLRSPLTPSVSQLLSPVDAGGEEYEIASVTRRAEGKEFVCLMLKEKSTQSFYQPLPAECIHILA